MSTLLSPHQVIKLAHEFTEQLPENWKFIILDNEAIVKDKLQKGRKCRFNSFSGKLEPFEGDYDLFKEVRAYFHRFAEKGLVVETSDETLHAEVEGSRYMTAVNIYNETDDGTEWAIDYEIRDNLNHKWVLLSDVESDQ